MGRYSIPIGAGKMRQSVVLQVLVETPDAYRQKVKTWADVGTYRCAIEQQRGSMVENAQQAKEQRIGLITMRYFGPLDSTKNRFKFGARILNIIEVEDVEERHETYKITYQEIVGAAT